MSAASLSSGRATLDSIPGSAKDEALLSTIDQDESYRDKLRREYAESYPNKVLALFDLDQIRRSMYQELRQNYATNLSWARSLEIDPFAEGFDPTSPAPPELSSWLYLFYSYLQLEEAYAETCEWLHMRDPQECRRLTDPPAPKRSFKEGAQEVWRFSLSLCWTAERGRPGSRASQHKRY
ncbi:hypothetical protein CVIRNUC_007886 [Coccomyxa viridis]|uniref:Uncharacterized protein n=1 Tax=Coccomyxa viridis TaxID=1274662 RepID=A0AAV1IC47_9CHLO|nr:hypothetical protein CVIRNUC_007886 [Coccomyxa viridis]